VDVVVPADAASIDERRDAFAAGEQRLFDRLAISVGTHAVQLADPPLRIRVLESGPADGSPLLLVHGGAGGFAGLWAPLVANLTGVRALAVDRPGHGLSQEFTYDEVDVRPHAIQFLSSTLDALGLERAALAGNSMGGLWCLWFALEHPERVTSVVQLGCPAFILDTSPRMHLLIKIRRMFMKRPPTLAHTTRVLRRVAGHGAIDRAPPELVEAAHLVEALPEHRAASLSLMEKAVRLTQAAARLRMGEAELAEIRCPVLFLWGEDDVFGKPEAGQRASAILPDGRVEVLAAGHLPWLDEPAACGAAVSGFVLDHAAGPVP
jgi:pimeloyl-ACP methyl ester carboxylesterase